MEIFLIYSANNSLLSKAIKYYTKETYNHVSLSLDENLTNTYSFGRKKISNPLIGGFVKEDFWDPFFLTSECAIYSLSVSEEEYENLLAIIDFFEENKSMYRYNFIGLLALLTPYEIASEHAYFCSEFVATLLEQSKITSLETEAHFVTPKDLLNLVEGTKVFEGTMVNYLSTTYKKVQFV